MGMPPAKRVAGRIESVVERIDSILRELSHWRGIDDVMGKLAIANAQLGEAQDILLRKPDDYVPKKATKATKTLVVDGYVRIRKTYRSSYSEMFDDTERLRVVSINKQTKTLVVEGTRGGEPVKQLVRKSEISVLPA